MNTFFWRGGVPCVQCEMGSKLKFWNVLEVLVLNDCTFAAGEKTATRHQNKKRHCWLPKFVSTHHRWSPYHSPKNLRMMGLRLSFLPTHEGVPTIKEYILGFLTQIPKGCESRLWMMMMKMFMTKKTVYKFWKPGWLIRSQVLWPNYSSVLGNKELVMEARYGKIVRMKHNSGSTWNRSSIDGHGIGTNAFDFW